jgi:hypothetical protein
VLVAQEIFGLHEHIKDVCRRLAKAGYLAIAPDTFARHGDALKAPDIAAIRAIIARVPDSETISKCPSRTDADGCGYIAGRRKDTELLPEAFGSEALRVLAAATQDHPMVIASKQPLDRFLRRSAERRPALHATIHAVGAARTATVGAAITIELDLVNSGSDAWIADTTTRGHVRVGVQLLDAEHRLINRDYARHPLPHDVPAGATAHVAMPCEAPTRPGSYAVKIDLVSEGVSWFEPLGSTPAICHLDVHV